MVSKQSSVNVTGDSKMTDNVGTFAVHHRQDHYDLLFKLITLGDAGVGKTSLIS